MKTYKVTQCCRCVYVPKVTEGNKNKMRTFTFSKDLTPGSYTEQEFLSIVGDEFIKSGKFEEYCSIGWIKVVEEKDVTTKTVTHFSNKL